MYTVYILEVCSCQVQKPRLNAVKVQGSVIIRCRTLLQLCRLISMVSTSLWSAPFQAEFIQWFHRAGPRCSSSLLGERIYRNLSPDLDQPKSKAVTGILWCSFSLLPPPSSSPLLPAWRSKHPPEKFIQVAHLSRSDRLILYAPSTSARWLGWNLHVNQLQNRLNLIK